MPSLTTYGFAAASVLALGAAGLMWSTFDEPPAPSANPDAALHQGGAPSGLVPAAVVTGIAPAQAGLASSPASERVLIAMPEVSMATAASADVLQRLQQRHPEATFFRDAKDVAAARQQSALYGPATPESVTALWGPLTEQQKTDGRRPIRYDLRTLESRVEGDTVDLWLPHLETSVKAQIEQVQSIDGLLRWSGRIIDLQEGGTFTITHAAGDQYAVGMINTPFGQFSLQSKAGVGWVVKAENEFVLPADGDDAKAQDTKSLEPQLETP
jgi:hypothetical protein